VVYMVEGTAEHACGPDQPKEGPLVSLVEHLVGVTREEPAHRNYDRDRRQTPHTGARGWMEGGKNNRSELVGSVRWMRRWICHLKNVGDWCVV
jgi:hypothetical protein